MGADQRNVYLSYDNSSFTCQTQGNGVVLAVGLDTGERVWEKELDGGSRYDNVFLISNRTVVTTSGISGGAGRMKRIYGLGPTTGDSKWQVDVQEALLNIEKCSTNAVALSSDGTTVFFTNVTKQSQLGGVQETILLAVDADTGKVLWTQRLPCFAYAVNEAEGRVVALCEASLHSYSQIDGKSDWTVNVTTKGRECLPYTAISHGLLLAGAYDPQIPRYYIRATNYTSGETVRSISLPNTFQAIAPTPWMIAGDLLVMPSAWNCNIFAWNLTDLDNWNSGYVRHVRAVFLEHGQCVNTKRTCEKRASVAFTCVHLQQSPLPTLSSYLCMRSRARQTREKSVPCGGDKFFLNQYGSASNMLATVSWASTSEMFFREYTLDTMTGASIGNFTVPACSPLVLPQPITFEEEGCFCEVWYGQPIPMWGAYLVCYTKGLKWRCNQGVSDASE